MYIQVSRSSKSSAIERDGTPIYSQRPFMVTIHIFPGLQGYKLKVLHSYSC